MLVSKKDIKNFASDWDKLQGQAEEAEDMLENSAKSKWQSLKKDRAEELFDQIPIDRISDAVKNMPLTALKNAGYHTLGDIRHMTEFDFLRVKGVGEKSANSLYNVTQSLVDATIEEAQPNIDINRLSDHDLDFLSTIYKQVNYKKELSQLKKILNVIRGQVNKLLPIALKKRNFFLALFQSSETKERIELSINRLNAKSIQSSLTDVKRLVKFFSDAIIPKSDIIKDFEKQNASYYAVIDQVVKLPGKNKAADLSEDLIDEIDKFSMDLNGMNATLRHYQDFGAKYALHFKRTLLGDEMGLGKTMQALAMFQHLANQDQKYSIVICPLSLLSNWERETQKFTNLKTYIFHRTQRFFERDAWIESGGVLITTYEHAAILELQDDEPLDAIVVDEAHYIKNPKAKRTQSVNALMQRTEYVLLMSGTPLENRLNEMKQLIHFLQPDIAGQISTELFILEPGQFRQIVAPVYLRRNRDDVLGELPALNEVELYMPFGRHEAKVYERAVEERNMMLMRRAAWHGDSPTQSPKLDRLLQICEEAKENNSKVLVFSFFRSVLNKVSQHLEGKTFEQITGDASPSQRQDIIDEFTEAPAGSVLVSQITAGGVGLNIQAANIVVLCEPQWKPSTEEQAISRAYRMGQSKQVFVYRLYTKNSVDETIHQLLHEKKAIFDAYARESDVGNESLLRNEEKVAVESIQEQVIRIEKERLEKEKVAMK